MSNTKITSHVIESGAVESTHIASGAISASHVTGITTANITENTNLYYTDTRARSSISVTGGNLSYDSSTGVIQLTDSEIRDALSAGTGVTYSGGQISIGQAVGTGDTVTFGNITTSGYLRGPSTFTIDPAAYGDDTGTLIIAGNLQVDGTTTTINSTTLTVDDLNITLASGAANAAAANGAGITVDGASATITYNSTGDSWDFNKSIIIPDKIAHDGDTDTFFRFAGANDIRIVAGNVEHAAFDGTIVFNQSGADMDLRVESTGNENMLFVDSGNNRVGIGTNAPTRTLYIDAGSSLSGSIGIDGSATGNQQIAFAQGGTDKAYLTYWDSSDTLALTDGSANGLHFSPSTGNVGIGTDSPDALLHVSATSPHIDIGPQGGNRGKIGYHSNDVIIGSTSSTGSIILKNNISSADSPQTSGDTKVTIHDVGMTIHSDTYNILAVQTDSNNDQTSTDGIIKITNNNGSSDVTKAEFRWDESEDLVHVSYGDHGRHVSINSSGNVGINTGSTSPTATLDVAGTALVENAKLKAIAESNTDTAVDVFVYDTRKDSDGGAWRHRTQNTSWYNEASGTNRSSRKEFPSVAVLAFNTNQELFIYDGDDPDLPIWAKYTNFTQDSGGFASITAINGSIYGAQAATTSNFSGNGYFQLNFAADYFFSNILSIFGTHRQGRADGLLTTYAYQPRGDRTTPLYGLVAYQITDIDTTVLPNAPIDADTGLPIPTIAVGTEAGVSIIRDNGTVVDITNGQDSSAFNYIDNLFFRKDGALVWVGDSSTNTAAERFVQVLHNLPTVDTNQGTVENSSVIDEQYGPSHKSGSELRWATTAGVTATSDAGENFAVGTSGALHLIKYNRESEQEGAIAHITSDYNTGYMHGSIKLAALSDTDTTNATDSNVVNNGTFSSNTNDWSGDSGAAISWDSGGFASVGNGGGDNTFAIKQTGILVSGAKYRITGRVQPSMSGNYTFRIRAGGSSVQWSISSGLTNGQWYSFDTGIITADGTSLEIGSQSGTMTSFYLDDVYVWKLEEEDRSYNNTGLEVHGTVTKTAVATGADLVAYSGFSSSNYLQQPYNSDLNFGTGDFSFSGWFYSTSVASQGLFSRVAEGLGGTQSGFAMNTAGSGVLGWAMYTTGLHSSGRTNCGFGFTPALNVWNHIVAMRKSGVMYLYLNGVLDTNLVPANTDNITDTSNSPALKVGILANGGSPATATKMALWRISATAPSEEQIIKMYNDEKHLFQDNTKATLYGSSDAVTALAYDDDTELLHAGTSAGRSVFQGLRRVDNTTDAVGAAISASNGFIVEE